VTRAIAALVAVACVVAASAPARAGAGSHLGVIELPDDLDHALRVALEPWGIQIDPVTAPAPSGKGAEQIAEADAVATAASVSALLWVTDDGGGSLWVYDVATGELSVRHVPAARNAADAAAIAQSAKAMLEETVTAPPAERFGATETEVPQVPEVLVPGAVPPPPRVRWRVHTQLGVHEIDGSVEPRLGVAVSWWPRRTFGLALGAQTGPGVALSDPAVVARFTDNALGAAARVRFPLAPLGRRFALDGGAGLSLHLTALDGFAPDRGAAIAVTRLDASLDVDALVAIALGSRAELAVGADAALALRRQRYLAAGTPVLELPVLDLRAVVEVRVELP
jgi:hypothetical protein